jgi:hypothetical protein
VWVRVVSEGIWAFEFRGGGPQRWRVGCMKWELGYFHCWFTRGFGGVGLVYHSVHTTVSPHVNANVTISHRPLIIFCIIFNQ